MKNNLKDTQLLQRIAKQDRQALSDFYERYAAMLYTTASRILRTSEEAAQVLEEVFLQIWDEAGAYDAKWSEPFHWVLSVTRQKATARLKAQKRRYSFVEELTQETAALAALRPAREDEFPGLAQHARIHAAVESLPLEQRQTLELAFLGGLTPNEIVAALNQPAATIKTRIRRGLLGLRDGMRIKHD